MSYKFSQDPNEQNISRLFREIEDNIPGNDDIAKRLARAVDLKTGKIPDLNSIKEEQEIAHHDGTNYFLYRKIGGKLFKYQLTEV